jgi:hypothetical protein
MLKKIKIGDRVRVKEDCIDSFLVDTQAKVDRGRIGTVGALHDWGRCLVHFSKDGRRRELSMPIRMSSLELTED